MAACNEKGKGKAGPKMSEAKYLLHLVDDALIMIDLLEDYVCLPDRVGDETHGYYPTVFNFCGRYKLVFINMISELVKLVDEFCAYIRNDCSNPTPRVEILEEIHRKSGFLPPKRAHRPGSKGGK